jgi:hypothetical protein
MTQINRHVIRAFQMLRGASAAREVDQPHFWCSPMFWRGTGLSRSLTVKFG